MFLALTAAALIAGTFALLGALAVKVTVLTWALQGAVAISLVVTLAAIWSVIVARRRR
jgi:hypothetical protein